MQIESMINLQGTMFLLVIIGMVLRKKGILPPQATGILTDLVLYIILPCNIISSFQMEFSMKTIQRFGIILFISFLIQVGCGILSRILYRNYPSGTKKVLQYATMVSNAGFLGNPIAEGVYGATGLMFASVYLIPQRIVMWSAGLSLFTESPSKKEIVKKVLTHPCIIAVYIGMALMVTQITLPSFLGTTVRNLGGCTTSLSMLLIGTILAEVDFRTILSKTMIYYTLIRLVFIPLLVLIGCRVWGVDSLLTGVSVLLAGMPAGSTTAILAKKYDGDYIFATKCVVFTTFMSLFAIPIWCMFL